MLTVLEALNKSSEYLDKKGIESPRTNAELMLAHILKCKRLQLYLSFDKPLKENERNMYKEFLLRRAKHEPVQYITGNVEFYGLEFIINKSVLIPRPETELLVETILKNVTPVEGLNILDIGTGSGNIVVSLAKNLPNSKFTAIDKSSDALDTAKKNSELNKVNNQINFLEFDILTEHELTDESFDLIVSNPPYVSNDDFKNLAPELNKFEPEIALTDFSDGYYFYKCITEKASQLLKSNGKIFFELGAGQSKKVNEILQSNNFCSIEIVKDYQNHDRVIYGELK